MLVCKRSLSLKKLPVLLEKVPVILKKHGKFFQRHGKLPHGALILYSNLYVLSLL